MPRTIKVKVPDTVGDAIGISKAGDPPTVYDVTDGTVTVDVRDVPDFLRLVEGSTVNRKEWADYLTSLRPRAEIVEVDPTRASAADLDDIAAEVTAPVQVAKAGGGSVVFHDGTELVWPDDGSPMRIPADKAAALRADYPDAFGFDGNPAPAAPDVMPAPVEDAPKKRRRSSTSSPDTAPAVDSTTDLDAAAAEGPTTDGLPAGGDTPQE